MRFSPHLPLGPGREFDRIRRIAAQLGTRAGSLGDDAARIPEGSGELVTSVDLAVENVHFRREWLTPEEIGWRAVMGALSDLAAAAAEPVGLLAALALPSSSDDAEVEAVIAGIGSAAAESGTVVLGGDLSQASVLALAITVFGRAPRPMSRAGAAAGDSLVVSGRLGGARAAVEAWSRGLEPDSASRAAFARPRARIGVGRWLADHGAHALIDLSDGLAGDVRHLAAASRVGAAVELGQLPLHPSVAAAADAAGEPPQAFAAVGGEDYELLAALPSTFGPSEAAECERQTGIPLTHVGRVTSSLEVRLVLEGHELSLAGYDHFA